MKIRPISDAEIGAGLLEYLREMAASEGKEAEDGK
jgi:hypothetical protein